MQHRDGAAEHQRLQRFGGGVDDDGAGPLKMLAHLVAQLLAQLVVQVGQRLVEQQQPRFLGQRARYRGALLLAAAQLGGQALQQAVDLHASPAASRTVRSISALGSPASFSGEAMLS